MFAVPLSANKSALPAEMEDGAPLSAAEVDALFAPLLPYSHILLAVSGGPDSMALMGLSAEWAKRHAAPHLSVATVDHGFRPEAQAEALFVAEAAAALGLKCHCLKREGPMPQSGLQEVAREARYRLLYDCAQSIGAQALVTAHHADDQAETVLMRLCHASGPAGLAGMRADTPRGAVALRRPFLTVPHNRLVASLTMMGLPSLNDPSNADLRFERVRIRQLAQSLAELGLTRERLILLGQRAARADAALERAAEAARQRHKAVLQGGDGFAPGLFGEPREIIIRVLAQAIARRGSGRSVRLERLEDLVEALCEAKTRQEPLGRTLGGVVIRLDETGRIGLFAEGPRRG